MISEEAVLREIVKKQTIEIGKLKNNVKKLEDELMESTLDIAKLKKEVEGLNETQKVSNHTTRASFIETTLSNCDDGFLLSTLFIRKDFGGWPFFGLVTRFNDPFFEVVYEDGDCEDVTKEEIVKLSWNAFVPSDKMELCKNNFNHILTKEKEKNNSSSSSWDESMDQENLENSDVSSLSDSFDRNDENVFPKHSSSPKEMIIPNKTRVKRKLNQKVAAPKVPSMASMAIKALMDDQDSDSDVIFIGSNPAPPCRVAVPTAKSCNKNK